MYRYIVGWIANCEYYLDIIWRHLPKHYCNGLPCRKAGGCLPEQDGGCCEVSGLSIANVTV